MRCLNNENGPFIDTGNGLNWVQANGEYPLADQTTVTVELGDAFRNEGILVNHNGNEKFFPKPAGGKVYFMGYGNPQRYVLILRIDAGGTNRVSHVNVSGGNIVETPIGVSNPPPAGNLPVVHHSQVVGDLFFTFHNNGRNTNNIVVWRSDTGEQVCGTQPRNPDQEVTAEIVDGEVRIKVGNNILSRCALSGECEVEPVLRNFPDILVGQGVPANRMSSTADFTIANTGSDCLHIDSIQNSAHFEVVEPQGLINRDLQPGDSLNVTVRFSSNDRGRFRESLPILPAPQLGDTVLEAAGEARLARVSVSYSNTLSFGRVPVGSANQRNLTIRNDGETSIDIDVPGSMDQGFSWAALNNSLAPGESEEIQITFRPQGEGAQRTSLTFTSDDADSPHTVNLSGSGCVARPDINLVRPSGPSLDIGAVEQGFRGLKRIKLENPGSGVLNAELQIQGADAELFGIQEADGSITNPLSRLNTSINPASPCGNINQGIMKELAIVFYANSQARAEDTPFEAELVINHNVEGLPELRIPITAVVTPPIALDAELVIDRSGSMGRASGGAIKSQVATQAAQLFIMLMRPEVEDRVGVVTFNDQPDVDTSIETLNDNNRRNIARSLNPLLRNTGGDTCIAGGIRMAEANMDGNPRENQVEDLKRILVVLTDGEDNTPYVDPDGNIYSLLGEEEGTEPMPIPVNKNLYAVGIGDSIDDARLQAVSEQTDGYYLSVRDFSGEDLFSLEKYYTQIFMDAVDKTVISDPVYTIQPYDTHIIDFDILRGDTSLMVVVYDKDRKRIPFYLESPAGEIIDVNAVPQGFHIRSGIVPSARFIELNFPSGEADRYAGCWKVVLEHEGIACESKGEGPEEFGFGFKPNKCSGFEQPITYGIAIGAGSSFRMTPFVEPGTKQIGESVRLNSLISEFGQPVLNCTCNVEVKSPSGRVYHYNMLDDGQHEDDDADDGNYGWVFTQTHETGFYQFTFRAEGRSRDGEPVKREAVRSKYIQGSVPLIPGKRDGIPGTPVPDEGKGDCCQRMVRVLWLIFLVMLIVILITFLR